MLFKGYPVDFLTSSSAIEHMFLQMDLVHTNENVHVLVYILEVSHTSGVQ